MRGIFITNVSSTAQQGSIIRHSQLKKAGKSHQASDKVSSAAVIRRSAMHIPGYSNTWAVGPVEAVCSAAAGLLVFPMLTWDSLDGCL